jgi:S1-C subfamily serine protease/cytochrome c-type biogenesis protein CcmH/NrfG
MRAARKQCRAWTRLMCAAGVALFVGCRSPVIPQGSGIATGAVKSHAVVSIYTYRPAAFTGSHAQGTGFFIEPNVLVTNWHVIEGAASATVRLADGTDQPVEGVLGGDQESDLVLLRVRPFDPPVQGLTRNARSMEIGEVVRILGSPAGDAQVSIEGRVASRPITFDVLDTAIMLAATPDGGMSGAPVLDRADRVVGVLSRGTNSDGNSFMVPIERVERIQRSKSHFPLLVWSESQRVKVERRGEAAFAGGMAAFEAGAYDEAIQLLEEARELGLTAPREATASYLIGDAHVNAGRDGPASAAYRRALAMAPRHAFSHAALGQSLRRLGHGPESVAAYERALALVPTLSGFHVGHGWALLLVRNAVAASAAFHHAVKLDPGAADAWTGAAVAALALDAAAESRVHAQRAIRLRPDLPQACFVMARACTRLEDWSCAARAYEAGLRLRPDADKARFELGRVQLELGDVVGAQASAAALARRGSPLARHLTSLIAAE